MAHLNGVRREFNTGTVCRGMGRMQGNQQEMALQGQHQLELLPTKSPKGTKKGSCYQKPETIAVASKKFSPERYVFWQMDAVNLLSTQQDGTCLGDIYISCSLFEVVLFYKVSANTELVNAELSLLGNIQGSVPLHLRPQHFHQLINVFFMCFSV